MRDNPASSGVSTARATTMASRSVVARHANWRFGVTVLSAAAVLIALTLAACGGSRGVATVGTPPPYRPRTVGGCGARPPIAPGSVGEITVPVPPHIALGADHRTAFVRVPRGYRSQTPTPVVLEFHGAGPSASAAGYLRGSPLDRAADQAGFLDVFPQGLRYSNGNLGWNAYGPRLYAVAELPFVERLISRLEVMFCVDSRRVYASGISNGANMVNYLICRPAGRFIAAAATVAGPMYGQDDGPCAPPRPVAILDVHSVDDPVVPYEGLPSPPDQYPLPSVTAWLDGWARLDGCRKAPTLRLVAEGQLARRWTGCGDGAEILAYAVHAGHAWPATLGRRPAADVVWQFFQIHSLRGATAGPSRSKPRPRRLGRRRM